MYTFLWKEGFNMISKQMIELKNAMKEKNIQAYIIPTSDFHDTETAADYFAARKYFSGFTGSAGVLVVLEDKAALWTDGRYFIQAENELANSGIDLMKQGQEGVPSIEEYILSNLKEGQTVGFDGRTIGYNDAMKYKEVFETSQLKMNVNLDLVSEIWKDRPERPHAQTFYYSEKYSGRSISQKLEMVRKEMNKLNAYTYVVTKIDEVAWLYNIRAKDIENVPLPMSYALVTIDQAMLYIDSTRLDDQSQKKLKEANVQICEYDAIYEDVTRQKGPVLLDPSTCNSRIAMSIQEPLIKEMSPIILLKACKNEVELENTKWAHIKDGVAVTKFMYWLKQNVSSMEIDEVSASKKLTEFRSQQENYIEDSFTTIPAYKENAAMMHYHAKEGNCAQLKPEGLFLVDSGGHYYEGTTDITRTFVLGPLSDEEKYWFTKAMRSHIRLAKAHFLYGCHGYNLDILSRGPLWDEDLDYQCGTGHGVGHLSNVHECPNGFRWRIVPERNDSCVLEEGMIQSNEPGVYIEGKMGIRHENEYVVVKGKKNFYGQFMHFECLTWVPFDSQGIDPSLMMKDEIEWYNWYQNECYNKLASGLNEDEKAWLKEVCKPL